MYLLLENKTKNSFFLSCLACYLLNRNIKKGKFKNSFSYHLFSFPFKIRTFSWQLTWAACLRVLLWIIDESLFPLFAFTKLWKHLLEAISFSEDLLLGWTSKDFVLKNYSSYARSERSKQNSRKKNTVSGRGVVKNYSNFSQGLYIIRWLKLICLAKWTNY